MKGQILDFSIQKNSGVISGEDGSRYIFSGAEWKDNMPPSRAMNVDFEVDQGSARGVYRAIGSSGVNNPGSKSKAALTLWAIFLALFAFADDGLTI